MRPLLSIALGLVVVLLDADAGGWDLLADPAGWVLVLVGTLALPAGVGLRTPLRLLAIAAFAVSAVTWAPYVATQVREADPGVVWALGLPELGWAAVLAHALAGAATDAGRSRDATWWRVVRTVTIVVALLPAVVIGGGVERLRAPAAALGVLVPLAVVVLLVVHAGRGWAHEGVDPVGTTNGPPP